MLWTLQLAVLPVVVVLMVVDTWLRRPKRIIATPPILAGCLLALSVSLDQTALLIGHPVAWGKPLVVLALWLLILTAAACHCVVPTRTPPAEPTAPPGQVHDALQVAQSEAVAARQAAEQATRAALADCHTSLADSERVLLTLREQLEGTHG